MKKIFEAEYPEDLISLVSGWIEKQTIDSDGVYKIRNISVVVELFDQDGKELVDKILNP